MVLPQFPDFGTSVALVVLLMMFAFAAGFVDAIAGGGGMIQSLALLMIGIPPLHVLATNKAISCCGTMTAVMRYGKAQVIPRQLLKWCIVPCLIASAIGSNLVMFFSEQVIKGLIIVCIPIALVALLLKKPPADNHQQNVTKSSVTKSIATLSPIAFYDGLVGPGTGTYMAIVGHRCLGLSLVAATGLAKPLNLAANTAAFIVFLLAGKVLWSIAIPMIITNVLGAFIGSHLAIRHGDSFIKNIMASALTIMLVINIIKALLQQ